METDRCAAHADMAERIARIDATTAQILTSLHRLEERVYQSHGETSRTSGAFGASMKVVGVAAAIGAAVAATVAAVVG